MDTDTTPTEPQTLEALLRQNIEVTKENNAILKDMRRIGRIAFWAKVVIWTLLIVVPLLLIGPIIDSFTSIVSPESASGIMGLPSPDMIKEAIELYTGKE